MNLRDRLDRALGDKKSPAVAGEGSGSDVRERLGQLMERKPAPAKALKKRPSLQEVLSGQAVKNQSGEFILVKRDYHKDSLHGMTPLSGIFEVSYPVLELLSRNSWPCGIDIESILFLDTETTGLAGGAGTCAFLVGAGFFSEGAFHLHQFFMRDYDEEKSMLEGLRELMGQVRGFITFNGKAFDIPLLEERFILQRNPTPLRNLPHIDLLFPARRLWKGFFEDCRLSTLEENILDVRRDDDIPGCMIPQHYFDFVRTGRTSMLKKIFSHNRMDILTLVTLTARMAGLLQDPLQQKGAGLVKLGRFHQDLGNRSLGRRCLEAALACTMESNRKQEAAKHLSLQYRREGRYDDAAVIWQKMAEECLHDPFPAIELAKYFEHRKKDPAKALQIISRLLSSLPESRRPLRAEVETRINRLRRKIAP